MPRISAEARAAAVWRAGGRSQRKPPPHLSPGARRVWKEIVEDRPEDYFRPGSLHLLEMLCVVIELARQLAPQIDDPAVAVRYLKLSATTALLCQKLRLSIQSSTRLEAGILNEPGAPKKVAGKDVLFGGGSGPVKF
jgi:hypothetical protein